MKRNKVVHDSGVILLIAVITLAVSCTCKKCNLSAVPVPVGVKLHHDSIQQFGGYRAGDNWCQTWAADDNVYAMLDDGYGFISQDKRYNNIAIRVESGPEKIIATELKKGYPDYPYRGGWYAYGIISVDGILFTFVSNNKAGIFGPFQGNKLFYSTDFGKTWYNHTGNPAEEEKKDTRTDKVFFWREGSVSKEEKKAYPFSWISFCQNGRDNAHADKIGDPYVYLYSPEPAECWKLNMARVKKTKIRDKSSYEFFQGFDKSNKPVWTGDINKRGFIHEFPEDDAWGWYSWQPSVVWNEGFQCYIMANYGIRFGFSRGVEPGSYWNSYVHDKTGSIGFWYSKHPWGPWQQIYYDPFFAPIDKGDRTYQVKLNPKWIKDNGRTMYIVWSDARDKWTTNYLWNQMKITIIDK